jgi:sphinganine-1-phosphate aldolase
MHFPRARLPAAGRSSSSVFAELFQRKGFDADWLHGRVFSLIYPTGRSDVDGVLLEANLAYLYENALNPLRFPSLGMMQHELVGMISSLLNAPGESGAGFSAGGTESILLSVLTSRERAKAERGVEHGNIVFPSSAHPAFAKAAFYTGLEARATPLAPDFRADVKGLTDAVDENTVLIVGSAYGFPHGVIDPIEELSDFALSRNIAFHCDACIGGFVLPFMERLGYHVPAFDFRLPGVTQMSCDIHKYGYATKGASVVVYREAEWMNHQMFGYDLWPAGFYWTPSVAGARAASPIAAAWAVMNYLGEDGYTEIMRGLMTTTARMRSGIASLPGLEILADPVGPLLAFTSTRDDIFAIGDVMDRRGWHLSRVTNPPGLHMMLSPLHAEIVEEFLADLAHAVADHDESQGSDVRYN